MNLENKEIQIKINANTLSLQISYKLREKF